MLHFDRMVLAYHLRVRHGIGGKSPLEYSVGGLKCILEARRTYSFVGSTLLGINLSLSEPY